MKKMDYKGFVIEAGPYQIVDSGEWTVDFYISHDVGASRNHRKFGGRKTFKTEEEAVQYCFKVGQDIIDGKVSRCSVADL